MQIEIIKEINHIPVKTVLDIKERDGLYYVQYKTKPYSWNWIKLMEEKGFIKIRKSHKRVDIKRENLLEV